MKFAKVFFITLILLYITSCVPEEADFLRKDGICAYTPVTRNRTAWSVAHAADADEIVLKKLNGVVYGSGLKEKLTEQLKHLVHLNIKNGRAEVSYGYNRNYDLGITFEKVGANSLPDFGCWYYIDKAANDYNFSVREPFKMAYTDYFSPYFVKALYNIDGDLPYSQDFTGGNHGYAEQGGESSDTARNVELKMYADGVEVNEFTGFVQTLDIAFTNRIQATNTKKLDGSGREVLEEKINIHFDGDKWRFKIQTKALEDVVIYRYYGPQYELGGTGESVAFVSGGERSTFGVNQESKSANQNCCKIEIDGFIDAEIMAIGSVDKLHNSEDYNAFFRNYGKAYFYIINSGEKPLKLNQGEYFTVSGYYRFKEK